MEESYHSSIIGLVFSNMKSTNKGTAQLKHGSGSNYRLRPEEFLGSGAGTTVILDPVFYSVSELQPADSAVQHLLVSPRLVLLLIEDIHLLLEFVRSLAFSDICTMPKQLN